MDRNQERQLVDFMHRLADASGAAIMPHFRKALDVENKLDVGFDPVTIADRQAESAIRALIKTHFPKHGILGEEEGQQIGESAPIWVIDPIDGTRAFMIGAPQWGSLIAYNDGQKPVIGMLDQPFLRERFLGTPGQTLLIQQDGRTLLRTRDCPALDQAILSTTDPFLFAPGSQIASFDRLRNCVRLTRYGGDCYAYGLLAMGQIDLVVEAGLKPYDIQALIPIVEGAGGIVTTWQGGDASQGGTAIAAGNAKIHALAMAILNQ